MPTERLFILKMTFFGLGMVLLLLVSMRMTGRVLHMSASSMYSTSPRNTSRMHKSTTTHRRASPAQIRRAMRLRGR